MVFLLFRYWAVAIPAFVLFTFCLFTTIYFCLNLLNSVALLGRYFKYKISRNGSQLLVYTERSVI